MRLRRTDCVSNRASVCQGTWWLLRVSQKKHHFTGNLIWLGWSHRNGV